MSTHTQHRCVLGTAVLGVSQFNIQQGASFRTPGARQHPKGPRPSTVSGAACQAHRPAAVADMGVVDNTGHPQLRIGKWADQHRLLPSTPYDHLQEHQLSPCTFCTQDVTMHMDSLCMVSKRLQNHCAPLKLQQNSACPAGWLSRVHAASGAAVCGCCATADAGSACLCQQHQQSVSRYALYLDSHVCNAHYYAVLLDVVQQASVSHVTCAVHAIQLDK
jgi:hypothetical protein